MDCCLLNIEFDLENNTKNLSNYAKMLNKQDQIAKGWLQNNQSVG